MPQPEGAFFSVTRKLSAIAYIVTGAVNHATQSYFCASLFHSLFLAVLSNTYRAVSIALLDNPPVYICQLPRSISERSPRLIASCGKAKTYLHLSLKSQPISMWRPRAPVMRVATVDRTDYREINGKNGQCRIIPPVMPFFEVRTSRLAPICFVSTLSRPVLARGGRNRAASATEGLCLNTDHFNSWLTVSIHRSISITTPAMDPKDRSSTLLISDL